MPGEIFSLVFPADCRICSVRLSNISRIPVCSSCLREPQPFQPEFFCAACRTPFLNDKPLDDSGVCPLCRLGANRFDAAYAYGEYAGTLRKLIHLFKYDGVRSLAGDFSSMLRRALPRDEDFDVIVPMPLHWYKRWQRGFNQAALMARGVAGRTGLPLVEAVRKTKKTDVQAGLTRAERRRNVTAVFQVTKPAAIQGRHVLLIDDVLTTGATARSCADVLKRAGARKVSVLALARADRRDGLETLSM